MVEGNYDNGYYHSSWQYFYSNGQLKAIGKYGKESFKHESTVMFSAQPSVRGTQVVSKPIKIGKWYYYAEDGNLAYIEKYDNNGRLKTIKIKGGVSYFKQVELD